MDNNVADGRPMADGLPPQKHGPGPGARFAPPTKAADGRGTVRRLLDLARGHWRPLVGAALLSCLIAAVPVTAPLVIGWAANLVEAGDPIGVAALVLTALYVGNALTNMAQGLLMNTVGQRIVLDARLMLFNAMERLPLSFFDRHRHGDLMSRITNDVDNISSTISTSLAELMVLAITIVGMLVAMVSLSLPLTLIALVAVGFIFWFTGFLTRHTRPLFLEQQRALGELNAQIEEGIGGLVLVKVFGREARMTERFEGLNASYASVATRAQIWSGYLMPITGVVNNLTYVGVAVAGGVMAAQGAVDVGLVTSFLLYAKQFTRPFVNIASVYNTLQSALAGAERVFQVVDETPEPEDTPDALPLEDPRGHVVLDHVTFGYDPDHPVLKDVSLDIPAGTRVAVVGETGSGKTTLVNLLARFYDVDSGSVLIDGHDVRDYRLDDVRAAFGTVLQEGTLATASVYENVAYGSVARGGDGAEGETSLDPETKKAVERAVRAVGADGFVERLPQGYDTVLDQGGAQLSQGERQQLTIARAVMANAPILILDEATSSVDTVTEQRIRRAILDLSSDRTSIVIAHRLSTVRDSDLIVVLDNGRIVEQGTHDELVAQGGRYAAMWKAQTGE